MVERRRKPLILCSTKHVINSTAPTTNLFHRDSSPSFFRFPVGILRFSNLTNPSVDHSSLLALSTPLLKTLSITSGSQVVQTPLTQFPLFPISDYEVTIFIRFLSRMLTPTHRKLQWLLLWIHQAPRLTQSLRLLVLLLILLE